MRVTLTVHGMHCSHCKASVTGALEALPGVREIEVDLETGRVALTCDEAEVDLGRIRRAIEEVGFEAR